MNKLFFLMLLCLCNFFSHSQSAPDTIWVENLSDSTFIIGIGTMNTQNNKLNVQYVDQVFDSAGVANFAFNRIERNEQDQRNADLIKLKADALSALYSDVNSILQNFTGAGYLVNSFHKYKSQYVGYYQAQLGASQVFLQLKEDATATQVNAQGQAVQNGFSGTWDIINGSRWRLKDFFPSAIVPEGSIFNRLETPDNSFMSVGSAVVITKLNR